MPTLDVAGGARATRASGIADFKVPQYVAVRGEPLPRNPGGKVLKRQLREDATGAPPSAADR